MKKAMSFSVGLESRPLSYAGDTSRPDEEWLAGFHRGDSKVMERCYREAFSAVESAVGTLLGRADRETVIHEVFSRLLAEPELRQTFRGGSITAWIAVIARNRAIDHVRRLKRETSLADVPEGAPNVRRESEAAEARALVEAFRRTRLEPGWESVFEMCFMRQMSQRDAARVLGLSRTTVAYREVRIRRQLRRFLEEEAP